MLTYQQKEENFKSVDVILFIPNAREDQKVLVENWDASDWHTKVWDFKCVRWQTSCLLRFDIDLQWNSFCLNSCHLLSICHVGGRWMKCEYGAVVEWYPTGNPKYFKNTCARPICPSQISCYVDPHTDLVDEWDLLEGWKSIITPNYMYK